MGKKTLETKLDEAYGDIIESIDNIDMAKYEAKKALLKIVDAKNELWTIKNKIDNSKEKSLRKDLDQLLAFYYSHCNESEIEASKKFPVLFNFLNNISSSD